MSKAAKAQIPGARHEIVVRVLQGHSKECMAVESLARDDKWSWTTPWWHSDSMPDLNRARDGSRRHGYIKQRQMGRGKRPKIIPTSNHWTFIRLECNSLNCDAVAIIDERGVCEIAQAVLEGRL